MMYVFFFFNDTATTEIYTLSLHDALPIFGLAHRSRVSQGEGFGAVPSDGMCLSAQYSRPSSTSSRTMRRDRKSTRLNSSHANISYAVFCLKKKKTITFHPLFTTAQPSAMS